MNERIIELRKEAYNLIQTDLQTNERDEVVDNREHLKMVFDKFAELIVRECMMLCGAVSGAAQVTRPNDAFGDGAEKCKALINQHFGVEE